MKITRIETITCTSYRVMLWVRIHTDVGLVGEADTCYYEAAAIDFVHDVAAPYLIGQDPQLIERHHRTLRQRLQFGLMNGPVNALSAIDIALWDLLGQILDVPVSHLLGGPVRERIRTYNTCHGTTHAFYWEPALEPPDSTDYSARWVRHTAYDHDEFMWKFEGRTGELATSLLAQGITAMKIWPFDPHRLGTEGHHISQEQLDVALQPFRDVRDAVGNQIDLPVELHGGWNVQAAVRIAESLNEVRPMWIEDPLYNRSHVDAIAEVARRTSIPVAVSESFCGREIFHEVLDKRAAGILIIDLGWVGGLTEGHVIAALARMYDRPVATHDASGPLTFVASSHYCVAEPNVIIMEGIRASYLGGWFEDVLTALPRLEAGHLSPPPGAGLGSHLRTEFLARPDLKWRVSGN